ncbi:uncharacterized protein LOC130892510 [Diorhabda carinulata]|uniref:uncharacterized protein LOC130892510 n=1 Tax=Diorhabda carinulata TaxID=1163345 RepID=UPI0025A00FC9|nr:uncharacterized protein LOC130892510 [Diorhabda carinulata]
MGQVNGRDFRIMPTKYIRKGTVQRGKWTEADLLRAAEAVKNGVMGLREACRTLNNIPPPTLRRRLKNNDFIKKTLGPPCILGIQNELKIRFHIQKLQKHGFAPTHENVRAMAFHLADQLKIKRPFNRDSKLAGYDWLHMFLQRHPDLSVRKAEGVSLARCNGMNKEKVSAYFNLLETTLMEAGLVNKAGHIFNMDETGLQLNNKPGYVIAQKGSKNVAAITSSEKGETITVISCCNAEGFYIPPACIFKGKNKKTEFEDGMPPGSVVYMNEKSAYINTDLMFTWLKEHFVPRKPDGKILLLLDGHASHCNSVEMLEYADEHNVILFCLPGHTTQFLQPLDRCFFKSLKAFWNKACNTFVKANPGRKISRMQFGQLLSEAWSKAATVDNAVSAFKSTGICPFNPGAIPEYAYLDSEDEKLDPNTSAVYATESNNTTQTKDDKMPSTSALESEPEPELINTDKNTPETLLNKFFPVPSSSSASIQKVRKKAEQVAAVLTSPSHIEQKDLLLNRRKKKIREKHQRGRLCMKKRIKEKIKKLKMNQQTMILMH